MPSFPACYCISRNTIMCRRATISSQAVQRRVTGDDFRPRRPHRVQIFTFGHRNALIGLLIVEIFRRSALTGSYDIFFWGLRESFGEAHAKHAYTEDNMDILVCVLERFRYGKNIWNGFEWNQLQLSLSICAHLYTLKYVMAESGYLPTVNIKHKRNRVQNDPDYINVINVIKIMN